ncbi:MAG: signal peptidase I [Phycisphaerales bacterium JB043]
MSEPTPPSHERSHHAEESIKETLIAIIISFALAFVARSYVAEPFIIPTGSMAPTLLGAHMRFHSPDTGYTWASNPRDYADTSRDLPIDPQGSTSAGRDPIIYTDPMSRTAWSRSDVPLRSGDRILVQKYLYALRPPRRWDVAVFKHPEEPETNLIKRVVGLPGERLALIDGDIFTRANNSGSWTIQRKPPRVQRAVWQTIFDSQFTPMPDPGEPPFVSPWLSPGWDTTSRIYRWADDSTATLTWNTSEHPLDDRVAYNATAGFSSSSPFPVSDLRIRFSIKPETPPDSITIAISARSHDFEAYIAGSTATLRMRPISGRRNHDSWITLGAATISPITTSRHTPIELAHHDQTLTLRIDNDVVASAPYDWSASERLAHALAPTNPSAPRVDNPRDYITPTISITIASTPLEITRISVARDLHYQSQRIGSSLSRASSLDNAVSLDTNHFFMLGDNSPASRDARAFDHVDPWVANAVGDTLGVVHRDLIMGRAFLVYFPSPHTNHLIPIPDFSRMRLID